PRQRDVGAGGVVDPPPPGRRGRQAFGQEARRLGGVGHGGQASRALGQDRSSGTPRCPGRCHPERTEEGRNGGRVTSKTPRPPRAPNGTSAPPWASAAVNARPP